MLLLLGKGMNTMLSPRVLSCITRHISEQRSLWGLLIANEYCPGNNALKRAILQKARSQRDFRAAPQLLREQISAGLKLSELSSEQQQLVREFSVSPSETKIHQAQTVRAAQHRKPFQQRRLELLQLAA